MRKYEIEKNGYYQELIKNHNVVLNSRVWMQFYYANNKLFILFLSINGYNENVINKICFMRHAVGPFKIFSHPDIGMHKRKWKYDCITMQDNTKRKELKTQTSYLKLWEK